MESIEEFLQANPNLYNTYAIVNFCDELIFIVETNDSIAFIGKFYKAPQSKEYCIALVKENLVAVAEKNL